MSIREATQTGHVPESRQKRRVTLAAVPLWVSWFLGAAAFAAVIFVATHFSEERAFVRLLKQAEPWWVVGAMILQAGTYFA